VALSGGGGGGGGSADNVRAGGAFVELFTKDNRLTRGLAAAQRKLAAFAAGAARVGAVALTGGLAGGAAVDALSKVFTDRATAVARMSERVGVGAEKLSAFTYAAETTGQRVEDLAGHFENLAERVFQAANGAGGEAATGFQKLGLDAKKLIELDPAEQMLAIADAMKRVTNETERRGILSAFGGDQFQGLNELFKLGSGGIRERMAEAGQVGAVVTADEAKKAAAATREMQRATAALNSTLYQLGAALLPSAEFFQMIRATVVTVAQAVNGWVKENKDLVAAAGDAADGLTGFGLGLFAVAAATAAVLIGIKAAVIAFGLLTSPVGIVVAAVAGLTYALSRTDWGAAKIAAAGRLAAGLLGTFSTSWDGIKAALARGDLGAAAGVGLAGVQAAWSRVLHSLTVAWNEFKAFFVDGWHDVQTMAKTTTIDLVAASQRGLGKEATGVIADLVGRGALGPLFAPLGQAVAGANKAGGLIDPEAAKMAVLNRARDEQADRDAARQRDAQAAALRAAWDQFRLAARATAEEAKTRAAEKPAAGQADQQLRAAVGTMVRGQFGAQNALQAFAAGGSNLAKQQLDAQKVIAANTGDTKKAVGDLARNFGVFQS
jgi:hypothetical protein